MNFLAILIAAAAEFTLASVAALRSTRWTTDWARWITRPLARMAWLAGWPSATVIALVPALVALLVCQLLFADTWFIGFVLGVAVLLLMMGPADLGAEVARYREALRDTPDGAAAPFVVDGRGTDLGPPTGDSEYDVSRVDLAALALAADRAWFQPLFWFFVGGAAGVVLYRTLSNLRHESGFDHATAGALATLREMMEWLPARITTLALGVAGTLMPVWEHAREFGWWRFGTSATLVARGALAAADDGRVSRVISGDIRIYRINAMFALLQRALTVWLVVLALFALVFD